MNHLSFTNTVFLGSNLLFDQFDGNHFFDIL